MTMRHRLCVVYEVKCFARFQFDHFHVKDIPCADHQLLKK